MIGETQKGTNMRFQWLVGAAACALLGSPAFAQDKASGQVAESFEREIKKVVTGNFLIGLPKDYEKETTKRFPLIIFLHGSGERGSDIEIVKKHGPPKLIAAGKDMPFIVVSPQCPSNEGWSVDMLNGMYKHITKKYRVDKERVYLTGLSMGGFGTWAWAIDSPGKFAAIAPICGGGDPKKVEAIKGMPTWVFHGGKDNAVPIQRDQEMVDALKALGSDVKFTIYPEAGHDSWTETYDNPELYTWFLKHTRKAKEKEKSE